MRVIPRSYDNSDNDGCMIREDLESPVLEFIEKPMVAAITGAPYALRKH